MKTLSRLVAISAVLTAAMAGSLLGTQATFAAGPVVGHVYVDDNTATNTIAGFNRHTDGTLTPMAGSPYAAGGAGAGAIIGSQGAIQIDGKYLLAVDAGSNQVSVLRISRDGGLSPVKGSPFSSNGDSPVSIAAEKGLVFVANSGGSAANYSGFSLDGKGRLKLLHAATYSLPSGTVIGDVLLSRDGRHLAGTRVGTSILPSQVDSFRVRGHGKLIAAPGSPYTAQAAGPFGSEFRPTHPDQLFVSNAHAGSGNGTISAYRVAASGALKSIGPSPYPDFQTAPCWVEISHNGQYLFAVNTAVPSISRFYISKEGTLSLLGSTGFNSPTGLRPFDARLAPDGRNLYVVDAGAGAISAFSVSNGSLTELSGSPVALPSGATPFGVATN